MKTILHFALLISALSIFAGVAPAQVATGTPPFAAIGGGPDQVDLANLNVHLNIPIMSKRGRGLPLSYNLGYDSSIWAPYNSSGTAVWTPSSNWGFTSGLPGWNGLVTYVYINQCYYSGKVEYCNIDYEDYVYHDPAGTSHPSSYYFREHCQYYMGSGSCTQSTGGSTLTTDGSGYTISTNGATVTDRSGTVITTASGTLGTAGSIEDTNGNYISASTSGSNYVVTDTNGQTVLTLPTNGGSFSVGSGNVTLTYTAYSVRTNFGCSGIAEYGPSNQNLLTKITLPDNSTYTFNYEATPGYYGYVTGRISSVTLPMGGTIYYSYGGGSNGISCSDGSTPTLYRDTPDGSWTYARTVNGSASETVITSPPYNTQSSQTDIYFQGIYPTETDAFQGTTTLLQTTYTCYNGAASPCNSTSITLPITQKTSQLKWAATGQQSQTTTMYNSYGLITEQDDLDYGGSLLRKSLTTYASLGNGIADRPASVTICSSGGTASACNGSGTVVAQTTYQYDGGSIATLSGTPQHVSISGSRGNVTAISYLTSGSSTLSKSSTYYDTGNVDTATDVNGAQTTYNYPDATSTCGNTFPDSVSEPLGLSRSTSWNCTSDAPISTTDENNARTQYGSGEWCFYLWCPSSVTDPLGNTTTVNYTNGVLTDSVMNFNSGNSTATHWTMLDSLGRPHVSQTQQAPSEYCTGNFDTVETDYDSLGRVSKTTLPYQGTCGQTNSSAPGTATQYDALGRPVGVADSGTGTISYSYSGNSVTETVGPAPAGESVKTKQLTYDSLGRLTEVIEDPGSAPHLNYVSEYTYDALGDLTDVTQGAQTRSYSYDGLGRMTSETNPESGTTTYTYDAPTSDCTNSAWNAEMPGTVVQKQDADGNVVCYFHDQLGRIAVLYVAAGPGQGSISGCKHFFYDNTSGVLGTIPSGVTVANTMGRLAEAETDNCSSPITQSSIITDEWFSYDVDGRPIEQWQSTPNSGGYKFTDVAYWPNGAISSLNDSFGYYLNLGVDGEGRPSSIKDGSGAFPLSSTSYNAAGLPTQLNLGYTGDSDVYTYDQNTNRMTGYTFNIGQQAVSGNLTWNANGTLANLQITDPFNPADAQSCSYSHDDLARIVSDNCGSTWSQTYTYGDQYGNLTTGGNNGTFEPGYTSTNQTQCGAYDADGNATNDCQHTYTWDAYGRPVTIDGTAITYDALGRAVEYNNGGATEIYYSPTGFKMQVISGGNNVAALAPMPGGGASVWSGPGDTFYYRHGDWLGSSRLASTTSRTVYYDAAYAPYGQPYAETGTTDRNFTGMDQQFVSGLYDFQAREYNGNEGRWPSPDPAGIGSVNPADPQTWNRYAYVRNSPLISIDPSGMGDDWGGANGEDPYCLEDFCANGMPDYYGNDYNANDWIQASQSGFGCMWNTSTNTLWCPTNDCVPSTDASGCAGFYNNPRTVSQPPIWWLEAKVFASTLGSNFVSEFEQGGCFRQFLDEVSGDGSDATPAGAGPDDVIRQTGAAAATSYATTRGIVAGYETSSSIYRGILGATDTAAGAAVIAPLDFEEKKGRRSSTK